jgi:hypothetical protein
MHRAHQDAIGQGAEAEIEWSKQMREGEGLIDSRGHRDTAA